jgi:hypothetical protein
MNLFKQLKLFEVKWIKRFSNVINYLWIIKFITATPYFKKNLSTIKIIQRMEKIIKNTFVDNILTSLKSARFFIKIIK